jgi:hypothetical protein
MALSQVQLEPMGRRFNTAGPCNPALHYMIPAERRLPEAPGLVEQGAYFVVHAPRQTGKTTALAALAKQLTASGRYAALHFSCEEASAYGEDFSAAQRAVLRELALVASDQLPAELQPPPPVLEGDEGLVRASLHAWAKACPRPLVLFFDEIDSLSGASLLSVLHQLRAGFHMRPDSFPHSVALCGMRNVRDYKAASGGGPPRVGSASPFNVSVESLRLGDFTPQEARELYAQHTAETGQPFTEQALERAWELTRGQPWLLNALAREIVEKMAVPVSEPITAEHMDKAKDRLILARATHLDSLLARLREPSVRRVLEPMLSGELALSASSLDDDYQYVTDLGLITRGIQPEIANPIYREIIFRVLASDAERNVRVDRRSVLTAEGRIDVRRLLQGFADFWREHGEVLAENMDYPEVAAQLVLMAYLHWIVNGGGYIDREVGIGSKRIDLSIRWPCKDGQVQRLALEVKVWRDSDKKGDPLRKGLEQLDMYLARLGLEEGVLVLFDARGSAAPVEERTRFEQATTPSGRAVTVLRA